MPLCIFCEQNGEKVPAEFRAPQSATINGPWEYHPVCAGHASDWWDGSDFPNGEGAPAIEPLRDDAQ